jgi:hypothetical protein
MVHPLGDYACQPSDSTVVAHALTACYYMNGAAYTSGQTQSISNSCAKVSEKIFGSLKKASEIYDTLFMVDLNSVSTCRNRIDHTINSRMSTTTIFCNRPMRSLLNS